MVASASRSPPKHSIRNMKVKISFLYLMPVLVISDIVAISEDSSKDRTPSSSRRGLWKSGNYRRTQSKHWPRTPSLEEPVHSEQFPNFDDRPSYSYRRPNIILILTDDQDVELGSLNFMSDTSRLLKEGGAEFRHAYTTTPMCCPSRSSILTGLYVHNHNVYTNNDNCSNFQWQMDHETKSFATYLSDVGYHTGYFGKYLNKYNGSYIPPGWKEWGGLIMNSKYYNYSINLNGKRIRHGDDYSKDYYTDLVANDSINFLREWKQRNFNKPSLLVMSLPAPHGPEDSAPQYSNMFLNVTTHHTPSYDYAPNPDKQWILQVTGPMLPIHKQFTNMLMTKRLQTLQSVDNAVKRIYEQVKEMGELDNTYIIYTSDHGYHLGQFGLVKGKSFPFEFDVRIPFLVRGPGVEPGSIVNEIALNIDLAPTILDMAGLVVPHHMDGRSLMKLFLKRNKNRKKYQINWPDTFLIESSGRRELPLLYTNGASTSIISSSDVSGEGVAIKENKELLDVDSPHVGYSSKAERLSVECQRPEYASPCKPGQKWHCMLKNNRWRKHKCKFSSNRTVSLPSLRKCTCITEDGIVYTRFQTTDNNTVAKGSENSPSVRYLKLNKSSDDLVSDLAKSWRVMKRQRRNAKVRLERLRTMPPMKGFEAHIVELPGGNDTTACLIPLVGPVECSSTIYKDPAVWRASHRSLVLHIRRLQNQMRKLKMIQRHLEEMQPNAISTNKSIEFTHMYTVNYTLPTRDRDENKILRTSTTEVSSSHKHRHHHDETRFLGPEVSSEKSLKDRLSIDNSVPDTCFCVPHSPSELTTKNELLREQERNMKEHRRKKKERKIKKRAKLGGSCYLEKMNCFSHDKDHWRTPPFWTDDSFCCCMNSNNNTYNCIRTINSTHNFLYCEFITGLKTFYNVRIDPFQQWNRYSTLNANEKHSLKDSLAHMVKCKGQKNCGWPNGSRDVLFLEEQRDHLRKQGSSTDRKSQRERKHSRFVS